VPSASKRRSLKIKIKVVGKEKLLEKVEEE
jgi:hypothetical protein